jgi:hypothetical protein
MIFRVEIAPNIVIAGLDLAIRATRQVADVACRCPDIGTPPVVMAGLDPAIYAFVTCAGTRGSPGQAR